MQSKSIIAALLVFGMWMMGCDSPTPQPSLEHTGAGVVRSIDWYHKQFNIETVDGHLKVIDACSKDGIPVWEGMKFRDVSFKTLTWRPGDYLCMHVVDVAR